MRVLWAVAELGLAYDHVPLASDDPTLKQQDFLRLNPAGTIPTVIDDGFVLTESLAINLYLAKKYGGESSTSLYPTTLAGEADAWRWSLWAQAHLEPWMQHDRQLCKLRTAIDDHARPLIRSSLARLDKALAEQAWLIGGQFTIADLNVAAILSPSRIGRIDLETFDRVRGWLAHCYGRPAALETRQRFRG